MRRKTIYRTDREGQAIDPDTDVAEEAVANLEVYKLRKLMKEMPALERQVLKWRFGIGCEAMTLRQVGERLGWSPSTVLQVERRALTYLRVAWQPVETFPMAA